MSSTICTYNGDFHCDQVFACYLVKKLLGADTQIIRTRENSLIDNNNYVIGLGMVYDHSRSLYDHHQQDFKSTLKSVDPRKPFNIKLSCAGLLYHHYGRRIIKLLLNSYSDLPFLDDPEHIETLFDAIYEHFVMEIDAIANDVPISTTKPFYNIKSDLSSRVARLNSNWTDELTGEDVQSKRFMEALELVGHEFEDIVKYYRKVWLPAKVFVKESIQNRMKVHSSGAIIDLSQSGVMPWLQHLIKTEEEMNIEGLINFAIFNDVSGVWRLSTIPQASSLADLRIPFPSEWHGLSYSKFCDITGIPDCVYIHPLISDFETRDSCIAVAEKLIQRNSERYLTLNKAQSISDASFYSLNELSLEEIPVPLIENGHGKSNQNDKEEEIDEIKHSSSLGANMDGIPDDWNPMAEDAKSYSNTYQYDPNDTETVVQGFKSQDLKGICHHFLNGHCKFGVGCVYKHMTPEEVSQLDSEEVLIETLQSDIVKEGDELLVTVSCCLNPYSFYVVPAEDIVHKQLFSSRVGRNFDFIDPTQDNLKIMFSDMGRFYQNPANGENKMIFPAIGSLVAVRETSFFRAMVLDMSPDEDDITVMNIDTGIESIVDRGDVFTLKPQFASLPAFAIHCAIEVPTGLCVTDDVTNKFSELVLGKKFKAHFKKRDIAGRFKVDLFSSNGQKVTIGS